MFIPPEIPEAWLLRLGKRAKDLAGAVTPEQLRGCPGYTRCSR
jgi:hypothetical protein